MDPASAWTLSFITAFGSEEDREEEDAAAATDAPDGGWPAEPAGPAATEASVPVLRVSDPVDMVMAPPE